jgi:hypothetical protein
LSDALLEGVACDDEELLGHGGRGRMVGRTTRATP